MGQDPSNPRRTDRDRVRFESAYDAARGALARGEPLAPRNRVSGAVTPPAAEDFVDAPAAGTDAHAADVAAGLAAMARGEVALVLLAGGMATRFGGVVKALVPVDGPRSFLDLKALDVTARRDAGGTVPIVCLSSFATHAGLVDALAGLPDAEAVQQFDAMRLTARGEPVMTDEGRPSRSATGHGDLGPALEASGALARLRTRGVRTLFVCNVDNLTATLDPALLGAHRRGAAEITVEVAPKWPGDRGGAPARIDGVPQIVEGFRFPPSFDQDTIPVFNTNSLWIEREVLERDPPLDYFAVEKQADGATVIQLERLVGQLTAFATTRFVEVAREGASSRFAPVKDAADMDRAASPALEALRSRGILPR